MERNNLFEISNTGNAQMSGKAKFYCPCCGYDTLTEEPPGTYDICPICFWEDDPVQFSDPDYEGGANRISLVQGQMNYEKYGACDKGFIRNVIKPTNDNRRNPNWKKY